MAKRKRRRRKKNKDSEEDLGRRFLMACGIFFVVGAAIFFGIWFYF
jgi:hypothetical protein